MSPVVAVEVVTLGALVLVLDQASKALLLGALGERGAAWPRAWMPVRLRCVTNTAPGFGFVRTPLALVVSWCALVVVVTSLVLASAPTAAGGATRAGLAMALGGATGNLVDRLRRGGVVDFIDLRVWPVFNVADVGIVAGAALALWALLIGPGLELLAAH